MIYTVTLSPALDYFMWLDHFENGGLNRTSRTAFRAGGKGINVSIVLRRLGVPSICLGFIAGFVGNELTRLLDAEGIRHDFIQLKSGCSRVNIKIKSDTESEINANGPDISNDDLEKLIGRVSKLKSDDMLILSGNPPKNVPSDFYSSLMDVVSDKNVRVVLDTSGDHLVSSLNHHPYLIKPNKDELNEVFNGQIVTMDQTAAAALELHNSGAMNVLVSLGPEGALLVTENGQIFFCTIPEGKLIDSTGAGDSMVAGFIAKNMSYAEKKECLRFAVACGCTSAYSYELLKKEDLLPVYSQTPVPESFCL